MALELMNIEVAGDEEFMRRSWYSCDESLAVF